ncbi:hypothetical protein D3C72_1729340 [compost metagenome]
MPRMGFHHHRAARRQCGGGIAPRGGKRQREVAGTEDRHRPQRRQVLAQIRARLRLTRRQRSIDTHAEGIPATQHAGEQA